MSPILFLLLASGVVCIIALFAQLKTIRAVLDALTERVAALERKPPLPERPPETVPIPPSPLLERRDSPREVPDERKLAPQVPPPLPPPLPGASVPPPTPATPFNWEAFMGVKLFAWLGGLALFLGVVFLVKYSFENNLITPLGRIAIGAAVALALVTAGWWLARGRYGVTAQSLCATGIVILYADVFAAYSFYQIISFASAFFAM